MKFIAYDDHISGEPELPPPEYDYYRGVAESGFSTWFGATRRRFESSHPALLKFFIGRKK